MSLSNILPNTGRKETGFAFFSIRLIIQYIEDKLKQNKKHVQKQDSTFI